MTFKNNHSQFRRKTRNTIKMSIVKYFQRLKTHKPSFSKLVQRKIGKNYGRECVVCSNNKKRGTNFL